MCTPIESPVRLAAAGALAAHGDLALLVGVMGLTQVDPLGRGPVKALAPATSTEHTMADFMLSLTADFCFYWTGRSVERK